MNVYANGFDPYSRRKKIPRIFFIVVDFHWAVGVEQRCVLYWYQVDGSIPTFTLDIL